MKITVNAFGPEITGLMGREKIVDPTPGSTLGDLIRSLEEEVRTKHGWSQGFITSNFVILVNSLHVKTPNDRILKEGETVTILSPIGGG